MTEPKKVSKEDYDEFRSNMEQKYDYKNMTDEEKADFDRKIDQVAVVDDKTDKTDADDADDEVAEKGEFDDGHPKGRDDDDDDLIL